MLWLTLHMWFLLIATFALGLGVGWWIWGLRKDAPLPSAEEAPMGSLETDEAAGQLSQQEDVKERVAS